LGCWYCGAAEPREPPPRSWQMQGFRHGRLNKGEPRHICAAAKNSKHSDWQVPEGLHLDGRPQTNFHVLSQTIQLQLFCSVGRATPVLFWVFFLSSMAILFTLTLPNRSVFLDLHCILIELPPSPGRKQRMASDGEGGGVRSFGSGHLLTCGLCVPGCVCRPGFFLRSDPRF